MMLKLGRDGWIGSHKAHTGARDAPVAGIPAPAGKMAAAQGGVNSQENTQNRVRLQTRKIPRLLGSNPPLALQPVPRAP